MKDKRARRSVAGLTMAAMVVTVLVAAPAGAQKPGGQIPRDDIKQHPAQVVALFSQFVPPR